MGIQIRKSAAPGMLCRGYRRYPCSYRRPSASFPLSKARLTDVRHIAVNKKEIGFLGLLLLAQLLFYTLFYETLHLPILESLES